MYYIERKIMTKGLYYINLLNYTPSGFDLIIVLNKNDQLVDEQMIHAKS